MAQRPHQTARREGAQRERLWSTGKCLCRATTGCSAHGVQGAGWFGAPQAGPEPRPPVRLNLAPSQPTPNPPLIHIPAVHPPLALPHPSKSVPSHGSQAGLGARGLLCPPTYLGGSGRRPGSPCAASECQHCTATACSRRILRFVRFSSLSSDSSFSTCGAGWAG